jgi:hypothetical protein
MSIKHYTQEIGELALKLALEAKAVRYCDHHDGILVDRSDPDANSHAYALATNAQKDGLFSGSRDALLAAIKQTIDGGASNCPQCERMRQS